MSFDRRLNDYWVDLVHRRHWVLSGWLEHICNLRKTLLQKCRR